jgi:hypothetical protein
MGVGLEIADDEQVQRRKRDRVQERNAEQSVVADSDAAQRVQLGRQSELAEGKQDAEHQADRDAEREIFGKQVGKHPPDHADRAAGVDHILEQPQHLIEHEQHRGEDQRPEQGNGDRAGKIAVNKAQPAQLRRPTTIIWPQRQPKP